jgi:hypothetical protein
MENLSINDLISSESYTYSVSNIEDARSIYKPQETISLSWNSGNYVINTNEIYLGFDVAIKGTTPELSALLARCESDYCNVTLCEINGVSLLNSTLSSGKNLFYNW